MTLYVKKRIPVAAMQFNEGTTTYSDLYDFANSLLKRDAGGEYFVFDYLHNTWVQFKDGDWIVQGIRGEYYPVEESVFAETYEEYVE